MISSATFQPQAAAFTSLLHMCAKAKLWQKALEVFQAMRDYHPAVRPNTVHFSSLISACATAGRWEEAMQVNTVCACLTFPTKTQLSSLEQSRAAGNGLQYHSEQ